MSGQKDNEKQRIQALESELILLKQELLAQEHRPALALWKWLRAKSSPHHAHEEGPSGRALFWSVLNFFLSFRVVVIGGGAVIGYVTLLLMYQGNLISARQNYNMQQQIYFQAQSERRRLLTEIKEKLHEPSLASVERVEQYRRCLADPAISKPCVVAKLEPQHNSQSRSEFLSAYLDVLYTPLAKPSVSKVPALSDLYISVWDTFFEDANITTNAKDLKLPCGSVQLDLSEAFLKGVKLHGACLSKANLVSVDMTGVDFSFADMRGVDLTDATLNNAIFDNAILKGAELSHAIMEAVSFREADLQEVYAYSFDAPRGDFKGANLMSAKLEGGDMRFAIFEGANMTGAKLIYSNTKGSNFTGTTLRNANLSWTILKPFSFKDADLEGAVVTGTVFSDDVDTEVGSNWAKAVQYPPTNDIAYEALFEEFEITCAQLKAADGWKEAYASLSCDN